MTWRGCESDLQRLAQMLPTPVQPQLAPARGHGKQAGLHVKCALAALVRRTAALQSAKGLWTAGLKKSVIYLAAKVQKYRGSRKKT
jgi:hypothetical protein